MKNDDTKLLQTVHDQYAEVARSTLSNDADAVRAVAAAFGYSEEDLDSLPSEANMGLSCGNPVAIASLQPGEIVVDLGCGGGMDVLLAAKLVGSTGKAIGIDMTADMLARARAGAQKVGAINVEFHQANIDALPLQDNSVDCIISNCVINLAPDKDRVFREMLRVLKPGGRVAISDIALKQPLPVNVKESVEAYVGCISGAILIEDYQRRLLEAGFATVAVSDTGADLNAYAQAGHGASGCCTSPADESSSSSISSASCCNSAQGDGQALHDQLASVLSRFDANAFAASVRVHALKRDSLETPQETKVSRVQIYDKPMCCATGVCGPEIDPVLPRFAADLDWLRSHGHEVARYNLAQQPQEFVKNSVVQQMLTSESVDCLPVVMVDGRVVSRSEYPSRENLALWTGTPLPKPSLRIASDGGCCGDTGCC